MADITEERLSRLVAQIHEAPSPEEAFSRWMLIDIALIDGLMMTWIVLLLWTKDLYLMTLIGAVCVAFGASYLMWKRDAKTNLSLGISFLDSQTIIGDLEFAEQIGIEGYEYIVLPEATIDGKEICYNRLDLDEVSQALASPFIRFGGSSTLQPSVVDSLVERRLMELKQIAEERERERLMKMRKEAELKRELDAELGIDEDGGPGRLKRAFYKGRYLLKKFGRSLKRGGGWLGNKFKQKRMSTIGDAEDESREMVFGFDYEDLEDEE